MKKILILTILSVLVFNITAIPSYAKSNIELNIENDNVTLFYPTGIKNEIIADVLPEPNESVVKKQIRQNNQTDLFTYLEEQCLLHSPEINIKQYNINISDMQEFKHNYYKFAITHPDLLIETGFSYSYYTSGTIVFIKPMYLSSDKEEADEMRAFMDAQVKEYINMADSHTDIVEKLLVIHDEIIKRCKYDLSEKIPNESYHAYGLFKNNVAVCQGYSQAFYTILKELDIPCDFCRSDAANHIWNYVKLDGKWYHVDLTWDDPVIENTSTGQIVETTTAYHNNFLVSDASLSAKHGIKETSDWKTYLSELPDCDSKYYESECIFNASLPFTTVTVNGKIGFYTNINNINMLFASDKIKCGKILSSEPLNALSSSGVPSYLICYYLLDNIQNTLGIYSGTFNNNRLNNVYPVDVNHVAADSLYYSAVAQPSSSMNLQLFFWDSKTMLPFTKKLILQ